MFTTKTSLSLIKRLTENDSEIKEFEKNLKWTNQVLIKLLDGMVQTNSKENLKYLLILLKKYDEKKLTEIIKENLLKKGDYTGKFLKSYAL